MLFRSATFGRSRMLWAVKRTFSAYLLALISGMQAISRLRRIRTSWATRPDIICWNTPCIATCLLDLPESLSSRNTIEIPS